MMRNRICHSEKKMFLVNRVLKFGCSGTAVNKILFCLIILHFFLSSLGVVMIRCDIVKGKPAPQVRDANVITSNSSYRLLLKTTVSSKC